MSYEMSSLKSIYSRTVALLHAISNTKVRPPKKAEGGHDVL